MSAEEPVTVYLLHFADEVAGKSHYVGSARPHALAARLRRHSQGVGSRLTRLAANSGVRMFVARTWEGVPRSYEMRLKHNGHFKRLCPMCLEPLLAFGNAEGFRELPAKEPGGIWAGPTWRK